MKCPICRLESFNVNQAEWHELWAELDECGHNCPYYDCCDKAELINDKLQELENEECQ